MTSSELDLFVLDTDARSRIAIYIINHADSPLIAQLGDLSHNAFRGGFISGDGCMAVSGDASSILLSGVLPISEPPPIGTAMLLSPVSSPMGCDMTVSDERFCPVTPGDMQYLLSRMTDHYDFTFLCRMLRLDKKDFDHLNNGIFIRTFDDENIEKNPVPPGWILLPIRTYHRSLVRMNVLVRMLYLNSNCSSLWTAPACMVFASSRNIPVSGFGMGSRRPARQSFWIPISPTFGTASLRPMPD